jgi:hypothetical protein
VDGSTRSGTANDDEVDSMEVMARQVAEVTALMKEAGMDAPMLGALEEQMQEVNPVHMKYILKHARQLAGYLDTPRAVVHESMSIHVQAWMGL